MIVRPAATPIRAASGGAVRYPSRHPVTANVFEKPAMLTVRARALVNATGPWSDEIRKLDANGTAPAVRGSKGVHISVPRERLPTDTALTLLSSVDGRVMFIIPAGTHTIIGTTETATRAHPSEVRASLSDVDYLLASANAFFPGAQLAREDVVSAWAGIRPLVASGYGHGDANSASREHAIHTSPTGGISDYEPGAHCEDDPAVQGDQRCRSGCQAVKRTRPRRSGGARAARGQRSWFQPTRNCRA